VAEWTTSPQTRPNDSNSRTIHSSKHAAACMQQHLYPQKQYINTTKYPSDAAVDILNKARQTLAISPVAASHY